MISRVVQLSSDRFLTDHDNQPKFSVSSVGHQRCVSQILSLTWLAFVSRSRFEQSRTFELVVETLSNGGSVRKIIDWQIFFTMARKPARELDCLLVERSSLVALFFFLFSFFFRVGSCANYRSFPLRHDLLRFCSFPSVTEPRGDERRRRRRWKMWKESRRWRWRWRWQRQRRWPLVTCVRLVLSRTRVHSVSRHVDASARVVFSTCAPAYVSSLSFFRIIYIFLSVWVCLYIVSYIQIHCMPWWNVSCLCGFIRVVYECIYAFCMYRIRGWVCVRARWWYVQSTCTYVRVCVLYARARARERVCGCVDVYVRMYMCMDGWMDASVVYECAARTTERVSLRETGTGLSSA